MKGATRVKGKGSRAAIRTSATRTKSPRGQKQKEESGGEDGGSKRSKGAPEGNSGEEAPTTIQKSRKGKSPKKRPATGTTEVLVEAPPRKEPKASKSARGSSRFRGENQPASRKSTRLSGAAARIPDEIQEEERPHVTLATQTTSGAVAHIPDEIEEQEEQRTYSSTRGSGGRRSVPENVPGTQPRHNTRGSMQKDSSKSQPPVKLKTKLQTVTVTSKGHRMIHTERARDNPPPKKKGQEMATRSGHVVKTGQGTATKNIRLMVKSGAQKSKNEEARKSTAFT